MKPVNIDGRPIYPNIFKQLQTIGTILEECGWRESINKPNLFLKEFEGVMVFADMRGTSITPIWEEPYPLLYADTGHLKWKRRHALQLATDEITEREVKSRISWPEQFEPDGLFFGPEEELPDGFCKMCGKHILEKNREGTLFCSSYCENAFSQLMEFRREEDLNKIKCALCSKPLLRWNSDTTVEHHIQYEPEEKTVFTCRSCHVKIHSKFEEYPELAPKQPPDWKRYNFSGSEDETIVPSLDVPPVNNRDVFWDIIDNFLKSELKEKKIDFDSQELARYYLTKIIVHTKIGDIVYVEYIDDECYLKKR
jgi:hypothetical protein